MSKYILFLYKQFCDSLGKEFDEVNIFEDNDFISWIINMQKVSKEYVNFLSYIGVVNNRNILAEMNKGKYDSSNIDFFITHNPYNPYYLSNLDQIHLLGYNICLGMFGKVHDSDRVLKLRLLKQFADNLDEQFKMYYDTNNDCYFGCIKSKRKVKNLVKTK